jgi:hypothetical protein
MSKQVPEIGQIPITADRQGTIVTSAVKVANVSAIAEVATLTPDKFKVGDVLTLEGVDYPITTVTKSSIKPNKGIPLVQKSANITLPENTTQPVKRFSFLIVKSF